VAAPGAPGYLPPRLGHGPTRPAAVPPGCGLEGDRLVVYVHIFLTGRGADRIEAFVLVLK
jgi:hypothetical protein